MPPKKILNDSKLINYLKTLSSKEFKLFEDYVNSPFFNKNQKVVDLLSILKKSFPKFDKDLTKKDLFCALFKEKKYKKNQAILPKDDQRLRHIMNYLTGYLQDFLIYQKAKEKEVYQNTLLLDTVLERHLFKLYPSLLKNTHQQHQAQPYRDNLYYRRKYILEESEFHFNLLTNNRGHETGLQSVINNLQYYYLSDQLRYYCAAINRENILNVKYDYPMLQEILEHLKENDYSEIPIVRIYHNIIMLLTNYEEDVHYKEVKLLLKKHEDLFPPGELRQMYGFVLNFCSRQIKKGRTAYYQERFDIYNNGLSKKVWNAGQYFSFNHFILMVRNALELGEINWSKKFVQGYKLQLENKYNATIPALSMAYISFYEKKFNRAHEYILQMGEPQDFYYELYFRTLMIQIFFEKSSGGIEDPYEAPIQNAMEALRFYINRNLSDYIKTTYSNFVKIMKRVCRTKFSSQFQQPSLKHVQKIYQDTIDMEILVERNWLLEKITELKNELSD